MSGGAFPMTSNATTATATAGAPVSLKAWEPALATVGVLMLAAMIPTGWMALTDERLLYGVNIWDKPLKFELSTGLFLLMASWTFSRLPAGWRHTLAGRYVIWAGIVATLFEVGYIAFQASRGQASHFNFSSAFTIAMYSLMGFGAVVLTSTALVQGSACCATTPVIRRPSAARSAGVWC